MSGLLIAISGPSGVGKGTIYHELLARLDNVSVSVSATTRAPRKGEIDGKHYHFLTKEKFLQMIDDGEFIEYAETVGNMYGTPKSAMLKELSAGKDVILEIDIKGVMQVVQTYPECVTIFVLPPSMDELERRLRGRKSETEEQLARRLELAKTEMKLADKFSYKIVNDDLNGAVEQIIDIIKTEKEKQNVN